jgi:hypothetical protein
MTRLAFLTLAALATFALRRIAVAVEAMRGERVRGSQSGSVTFDSKVPVVGPLFTTWPPTKPAADPGIGAR